MRGEIIVSMRMPAGLELPPHYHTGIVIAHTVKGAWRYKENSWVSRVGDTVYEVAGSSHTPESVEDSEIFFVLIGELLFLDDDKKVLWQENHKTMIERYNDYSRRQRDYAPRRDELRNLTHGRHRTQHRPVGDVVVGGRRQQRSGRDDQSVAIRGPTAPPAISATPKRCSRISIRSTPRWSTPVTPATSSPATSTGRGGTRSSLCVTRRARRSSPW